MKYKRLLGYGAIGLTLIAVGVAFIKPISASSILFRVRATDAVNYSQTISRATGSLVQYANSTINYVSTTTSSGNIFYLRNVNDSAYGLQNKYIAILPGSTDNPSKTPEITFTSGNASATGESLFEFQYIKSISITSDITSRTLDVYKSDDGSNWTSAGTIASAGGTNTDVDGANYIKITYSGSYAAYINTLTINYSCSYVPPAPKVLDSISVSGMTTEFTVGDTFTFDGTVTATYTDSSTYPDADVTSSAVVVEEPDMSEVAEDVEVVISYTEKGTTKTASYFITISEESESTIAGIYKATVSSTQYYQLTLNDDGSGSYQRFWTNNGPYSPISITYSVDGSTITFTLAAAYSGYATTTDFANSWKLFDKGSVGTTNTGTINANGQILIRMWSVTAYSTSQASEANAKVFTKQ